jgi:hypothetical protein
MVYENYVLIDIFTKGSDVVSALFLSLRKSQVTNFQV